MLLLFAPAASQAGWFGPSSFEECIEKHVAPTVSDHAAKVLAWTCRREFETESSPAGYQQRRDACYRKRLPDAKNNSASKLLMGACNREHPEPKASAPERRCWSEPAPPDAKSKIARLYGNIHCEAE